VGRQIGRAAEAIASIADWLHIKRTGVVSVIVGNGWRPAVVAFQLRRLYEFFSPDGSANCRIGLSTNLRYRPNALHAVPRAMATVAHLKNAAAIAAFEMCIEDWLGTFHFRASITEMTIGRVLCEMRVISVAAPPRM
jgi:hypothetical protein